VFAAEDELRVSDLNRDEMDSALAELANQLNALNVKAKICLVCGAVMVLAFDARFSTETLMDRCIPQMTFSPSPLKSVKRRGLGAEWLNNRLNSSYRYSRSPTGDRFSSRER